MNFLTVRLSETRIQKVDDRYVQSVHPHDGFVARVSMIVVRPARRKNKIARSHVGSFAFHGCVRSLAFDDESQRRGRVPVSSRNLSRQDQLQTCIQAVADQASACNARILEHQDPALGLFGGNYTARFH